MGGTLQDCPVTGDPPVEPQQAKYYVLQAQFRPLCVVTSIAIDEVYHDTNKANKKYINFQTNFENETTNIKDKIESEAEIMIINETKKLDEI
jgi:hypothetical protein